MTKTNMITLRQQLIDVVNKRYHLLAQSVFDDDWIEEVSLYKTNPFLFMAEGVFPYFEESQVRSLFLTLQEHFPGAELVCDAHTPFVVWADNIHLALAKVKARLHWSIKSGKDPESWSTGIKMLDEWNYYETDDPGLEAYRWMRAIPGLAKSNQVSTTTVWELPDCNNSPTSIDLSYYLPGAFLLSCFRDSLFLFCL